MMSIERNHPQEKISREGKRQVRVATRRGPAVSRGQWLGAVALFLLLSAVMAPVQAEDVVGSNSPDDVATITNSIGMKLARIPGGTFQMGSPRSEAEREPEEVLHQVTITEPFLMSVYEVTQQQWKEVMPKDRHGDPVFDSSRGGGPDHPVEHVTWKAVQEFCERLSNRPEEQQAGRKYRLPTEAEWEYAARAGTSTAFHFGDSLSSDQANFNGEYPYGDAEQGPYLRKTAPVGSYEPNDFGLYDMHGNVAEWCADWYDPEYYENSPEQDPLGPPFGVLSDGFGEHYVVVRGGSWLDDARGCRSAYRFRIMPKTPSRVVGFRVVCETEKEDE